MRIMKGTLRPSRKMLVVPLVLAMFLNLVCFMPVIDAAPPTWVTPKTIKVKGSGTFVDVTVKLTSHENATYGIKISEKELVTLKFELFNHGWSMNKTLAPGETYNFTVQMRTKTASLGQTSSVQFEIYENDVLVGGDNFNVTVDVIATPSPTGINCSSCGLIIPLFFVGGIYLTWVGRRPKLEG
jgi:hypothetical protein